MRQAVRWTSVLLGLTVLVSLLTVPGRTAAAPSRGDSGTTLTILTCCGMPSGFTRASQSTSNTIFQFYHYYHALWAKRFPTLTIKEIDVSSYPDLTTKTILGVNAGNPPDLIATQGQLGQLVARKAVQNLDPYYKLASITPQMFLPGMASWARMQGHWYAMPENSNPSQGELLVVPSFVKAAGWGSAPLPRTWDELWTATQKVTRWDRHGDLVRIGLPVGAPSMIEQNLFCGSFAVYDPATTTFHVTSPCIKAYFRFEKRLLAFYGGVTRYTKFISGDPGVWSCSPKAYLATGRILFTIDAYWSGDQMDQCYAVLWALSPPVLAAWLIRAFKGPLRVCACAAGPAHAREDSVQIVGRMSHTANTGSALRAR